MSREEARILLTKDANNDDSLDMYSTNTFSTSNTIVKQQQKYKAELEEFLLSIYEYWKNKRLNCVSIYKYDNHKVKVKEIKNSDPGSFSFTFSSPGILFEC